MKYTIAKLARDLFHGGLAFLLCACGSAEKQLFNNPFSLAVLTIPEAFKYDFGTVLLESTAERTFTVVNEGKREATNFTVTFTISAFGFKGGTFPGIGGNCQSRLAAQTSCTIVVEFHPQYTDSFTEFINLSFNNGERTDLIAAVELFGRGISGTAGTLDTTFQSTGLAALRVGSGNTVARQVVTLPDNKMLVAGHTFESGNWNFFVVRLLSDGTLDTSFGFNGVAIVDFSGGDDFVTSLFVQPDSKIVLGGRAYSSGKFQFALWRGSAQGFSDPLFGSQGKLLVSVGGTDAFLEAMALQSDGSVIAVGYAVGGTQYDFAAIRVLASSSLDGTFGTGGKVLVAVSPDEDRAHAVSLQTDGKILLGGMASDGTNEDMAVVRLNTNGALDPSFGNNGKTIIDFGSVDRARALAVQFDNKIVIAGQSGSVGQFALARLTTTGALDSNFGTAGKVTTAMSAQPCAVHSLSLQTDGKILATGFSESSTDRDLAIARYFLSGSLDTGFGTSGKAIFPLSGTHDQAFDSHIASNGKLVVVGESQSTQTIGFVARVWP